MPPLQELLAEPNLDDPANDVYHLAARKPAEYKKWVAGLKAAICWCLRVLLAGAEEWRRGRGPERRAPACCCRQCRLVLAQTKKYAAVTELL